VAIATAAAFALAGAGFAAWVIAGLPKVGAGAVYTGSARVLALRDPVRVGSDTVFVEWSLAEEIRLVRAFYDAQVPRDEPTLALPLQPLYTVLLERPNPTRFVNEQPNGDFILSAEAKRVEAARLVASDATRVIVGQGWFARRKPTDALREALLSQFHPVRGYGSILVLARGSDADWERFTDIVRRTLVRGPSPADVAPLRVLAAQRPDEPLVWRILGHALDAAGDAGAAADAFRRAGALDLADATPFEDAAAVELRRGRLREASADLARARRVRESPATQRLARQIGSVPPR
jgi:hypothetical protein